MEPGYLSISIDGKPLDEISQGAMLGSVEITQELNQHWWCRIECRQTEDRRFPIEDCLAGDLRIVARAEDKSELVLFDGFVLEGKLDYEIYGSYTARLTGVTRSYKLEVTPQQAYFRKSTLQDVANRLAGEDGLEADVQCSPRPPKNYVQWGESDFDFLKRLADDYDCWIRPTAGGIQIADQFQPGTTVEWRGERGLLSFQIEGKLGQPSFSGTHYNPRKMKSKVFQGAQKDADFFDGSQPMVESVKSGSQKRLPPGFVHWDTRAATPDEYEAMLKKESARSIGSKINGHGVSRNHELLPGNTIKIEGTLDARGEYGVTKVVHRWTSQRHGYENEFWCTPWKHHVSAERPRHKPLMGVTPARVVEHNDRRGMGRVQVKFPWQEESETSWARMTTPSAGGGRGFMFMPEKGDEVLVAFEHGDPERPMVVGALWNGVDQAPRQGFRFPRTFRITMSRN
jgi:type VI secretion system secreted protein VgrG